MVTSSLGLTVDVASSTKDSISVKWRVESAASVAQRNLVQGFEVRYQAIGSTVVQYSNRLDASTSTYDIVHLHENTYYDICVKVFARLNASSSPPPPPSIPSSPGQSSLAAAAAAVHTDACTKGTTATDSLWVALGSTFGAFLALGFIVFLVFLAKWQHSRKERKQKLMTSANYDDARVQQLRECDDDDDDDDYDPKGSSGAVHLPDDLALSELSGHSSELSIALYADQMLQATDAAGDSDEGSGGGDVRSPDDEQRSYSHQDHLHGWIAGAPYATAREDHNRHRSIDNDDDDDDSGIQRELLRPPPIPGIILRPLQSASASGTDHRLCSTEHGSGDDDDGNAAAAAAAGGGGGGDRVISARHQPLKPRASNLW